MKPTKRVLATAAMAAAGALIITGCASSGSGTNADGTFVIVTAAQPSSFSYETSATGYEAAEFFQNTGATLIRNPYIDGDGGGARHQDRYNFEPVLASGYEVSDDQLTYTFTLNTDATSTAGEPIKAGAWTHLAVTAAGDEEIGRASCRERVSSVV